MNDNGNAGQSNEPGIATLGGGCFWCLEAVFEQVRGVLSVTSGYSGGHVPNPSYEAVCTGMTGHAEVTQIRFDPAEISFRDILNLFFVTHDPTTLNRQGNDVGTQYRSVIYYHTEEQRETAAEVIRELGESGVWPDPIVTEVTAIDSFYEAEEYHRQYFRRNPSAGYCQFIIAPKVAKLRKEHFASLKA